jgi:hypothetical protein
LQARAAVEIITDVRARLVLVVACVAVGVMAAPAAASTKRCGRVYVPSRGLRAKVRVDVGPDSCGAAKRLVAAAFKAEDTRSANSYNQTWGQIWRVSGWACSTGLAGSQAFCRRGRQQVDGSFRTDDGWLF